MFFSVFSAVLLALLVYRFLTKATNEQKEKILNIIRWLLLIWLFFAIIGGIVSLIYFYRSQIANIFIFLLFLVLWWLPFVLWGLFLSWRKFKERKRLWLIEDWVKRWDFNDEFEKKRYENLTKHQKEIEDKRTKKKSKAVLWWLIAFPLLLLVWAVVLLVWFMLDNYF